MTEDSNQINVVSELDEEYAYVDKMTDSQDKYFSPAACFSPDSPDD
jgi:hypothetical protein